MAIRYRLMMRINELSPEMKSIGKFKSLLQAVRYVKNSYTSGLGPITLRQGLFWDDKYKQLIIGRKLAAYESLAMLVIEER